MQPFGATLESGLEYRLPAMAMPSDGDQTSDQAALPMQQRVKGNRCHSPLTGSLAVPGRRFRVLNVGRWSMSGQKTQPKISEVPLSVGFFVVMFLFFIKTDKSNLHGFVPFFVHYLQMLLAAFFAGRTAFLLLRKG